MVYLLNILPTSKYVRFKDGRGLNELVYVKLFSTNIIELVEIELSQKQVKLF
jgi:hypothetical protein